MKNRVVISLSGICLLLLTVASLGGIFWNMYEQDTPIMIAMQQGADLVNLVFVIPIMLLAIVLTAFNSRRGIVLLCGTLLFNFINILDLILIANYNQFFLIYMGIVLSAFWGIIRIFFTIDLDKFNSDIKKKFPYKLIGYYLIGIVSLFVIKYLVEIVSGLIIDRLPTDVKEFRGHVIYCTDLLFTFPFIIVSALFLIKKHSYGQFLVGICLVKLLMLGPLLFAFTIFTNKRELTDDPAGIFISAILFLFNLIILILYLKSFGQAKKSKLKN